MAKKGSNNKQKRLSVSGARHLQRKAHAWTIRQKPGAHTQDASVPLGFVVRDMLKLSNTLREARQIITKGNILVDGHVRKSYQFAVGLFDTVSIPSLKKHYRIVLDHKGRLKTLEASDAMVQSKPSKVIVKKKMPGQKLMIQTHDGKTFRDAQQSVRVGDSVLIKEGNKISEHLSLVKGSHVFITGGTHVGEMAQVASIVEGTMKRDKLVDLIEGKEKFQTTAENVMVIDANTASWLKTLHKEEAA